MLPSVPQGLHEGDEVHRQQRQDLESEGDRLIEGAQAIDVRSAIAPGTVSVFQMGAARAAQGTMGDYRFIAVGKVEDEALLDMIESALP